MSSITPTTGTTPTASQTPTTPTNPAGTLGKDDFLKLMVAQLRYQDPMQPTDTSAYLGQLAQFTQLEQTTNLAKSSEQSAADQRMAETIALIGRTVTYTDAAGAAATGTVQSVQVSSTGATLTIGANTGIDPSTVTGVS